MKIIAKNKRAYFDYEILKKFITGISLLGSEIKSIRDHRVSLKGSFVSVRDGEVFWKGGNISVWQNAGNNNHEENRDRKLLLNKSEIKELQKKIDLKGYTIVPLALGIAKNGYAKLEIALATGKKQYDKRQTLKEKEVKMKEVRKFLG